MSEIAKCPLCGNSPVIFPTFDPAEYCPEATECCGAAFTTVRAWNQYAAAMELAKATRTLEDAMEPLNSGKLKMGQALPAIRLAMEDHTACEQRVLEVFKNGHS